jgi:PKD repeat protein
MFKSIKFLAIISCLLAIVQGCKKDEHSFGTIAAPTNLAMTSAITGVGAGSPNGDGSGTVSFAASAENVLTYKFMFGDGDSLITQNGNVTHRYRIPGTNTFNVSVTAIGTGGAMSTFSQTITVFVAFEIPAAMMTAITNNSSRVWVTDRDANGHFGVGPNDQFEPIWYAAPPNTREACAYDDEITFAQSGANITMNISNMGTSFSIGAATGAYGFSGPDGCYAINTGGLKTLVFMDATSNSTPAQSTRIQFMVPGNGIINFGTGGTIYEILSVTATSMHIRNIGIDGNAWYQKLKPRP